MVRLPLGPEAIVMLLLVRGGAVRRADQVERRIMMLRGAAAMQAATARGCAGTLWCRRNG